MSRSAGVVLMQVMRCCCSMSRKQSSLVGCMWHSMLLCMQAVCCCLLNLVYAISLSFWRAVLPLPRSTASSTAVCYV